ncbi:DUF4367 domain-containing protein [Paenibacillus sp. GCM10027626]|uniref:outer membrane lipoprotein-sorting protein n=1 Tax=Paenibacillus sp. GCM10027626 TaxID=3273411 RepID=UPI00363D9C21
MRRRISLLIAVLICAGAVLAACGTKDAESVVKELDKVVSNMESYHGKGKMILHTGQQPLEYQVEVTYQKPEYYRIKLTNAQKDITQIVLRNDEGVFVLTPRLNKVFRFQSEWPANQGQVYLYQTLVQSILNDSTRQFVIDGNAYVFDVMANYHNASLARQKIWLDKTTYRPMNVEVSDSNSTVMVQVKFDEFEFDKKFDKSEFDTQRNMGGAADKPTVATPDSEGDVSVIEGDDTPHNVGVPTEEGTEEGSETSAPAKFIPREPSYVPEGVSYLDSQTVTFGGQPGIVLRYTGEYDFSILQTQPADVAASLVPGVAVSLGYTVGQMTGDEEGQLKTLTWTYDGIEYRLSSSTMPETEMILVAQSVQEEMGK